MPIPVTIADIDAAWLADALGADIDSIEVHPIAAGEGFMGQLARVSIVSSAQGVPRSVIVKLPTADPGGRAIGEMMRVWEREHCFYRDVAGQLNIRVPEAYVNTLDPPCLVLEDLAPAVPGDHLAGATRAQAERSIDLLARHHGAWFEHAVVGDVRLDARPRRSRGARPRPDVRTRLARVPRSLRRRTPAAVPALVRAVRGGHPDVDRGPPGRSGHADPRRFPPRQPVLRRRRFGCGRSTGNSPCAPPARPTWCTSAPTT